MLDALYIAATGMHAELAQLDTISNNLANLNTTAFKKSNVSFDDLMYRDAAAASELDQATGQMKSGLGAGIAGITKDFSIGDLRATENPLDVAIRGAGWFAVEAPDGTEAYTRAGDFRIDATGTLRNGAGHAARGEAGPITLLAHAAIAVGRDGAISLVGQGQGPSTLNTIARLKLVRPDAASLERGADGLFRLKAGGDAPSDGAVTLESGALESSNVNVAAQLVQMIETSRRFEWQMRGVRAAEENARDTGSLLRMG